MSRHRPIDAAWIEEIAQELKLPRTTVKAVVHTLVERWKRELAHRRPVEIRGLFSVRPAVSVITKPQPRHPMCAYCGNVPATRAHLYKAHAMTWDEYKAKHGGLVLGPSGPRVRISLFVSMAGGLRRKLKAYGPMLALAEQELLSCPTSPNHDRPPGLATATAASASSS